MKMKLTIGLCFMTVFISSIIYGQTQKDSFIDVGGRSLDEISDAIIDAGQQIVAAGYFNNSAYIKDSLDSFYSSNPNSAFLIKMDRQGNPSWQKAFNGTGDQYPMKVTEDIFGNIYVGGYFGDSISVDGLHASGKQTENAFIVQFDSLGKAQWLKTFPTNGGRTLVSTQYCDANGSVYVSVYSSTQSLTADGKQYQSNTLGLTLLTKYSSNGDVVWAKLFNNSTNGNADILGISGDNAGHIYISGATQGVQTLFGGIHLPGFKDTNYVLFIAKLNESTGSMLWIKTWETAPYAQINKMQLGQDGNLYASGTFEDSIVINQKTVKTVGNGPHGDQDIVILKLDSSGNIIWDKTIGTPSPDIVEALCLDNEDNLYITGPYQVYFPVGSDSLKSIGTDIFLLRYDSKGNLLSYKNTVAAMFFSYAQPTSLMIDNRNKIYMSGWFNYSTTFGDTTPVTRGVNDGFIWGIPLDFSGIAENKKVTNELALYPNPVLGSDVNIQFAACSGTLYLECDDITGKALFTKVITGAAGVSNYSITLPVLTPGMYFLKMSSSTGVTCQKFIKG